MTRAEIIAVLASATPAQITKAKAEFERMALEVLDEELAKRAPKK